MQPLKVYQNLNLKIQIKWFDALCSVIRNQIFHNINSGMNYCQQIDCKPTLGWVGLTPAKELESMRRLAGQSFSKTWKTKRCVEITGKNELPVSAHVDTVADLV